MERGRPRQTLSATDGNGAGDLRPPRSASPAARRGQPSGRITAYDPASIVSSIAWRLTHQHRVRVPPSTLIRRAPQSPAGGDRPAQATAPRWRRRRSLRREGRGPRPNRPSQRRLRRDRAGGRHCRRRRGSGGTPDRRRWRPWRGRRRGPIAAHRRAEDLRRSPCRLWSRCTRRAACRRARCRCQRPGASR